MIVVRVELWRFGNPDDVLHLGDLKIANVGGDVELGNYSVRIEDAKQNAFALKVEPQKIEGQPRQQSVWYLVQRSLNALLEKCRTGTNKSNPGS